MTTQRLRRTLAFTPNWDDTKGWAAKFIRQNQWRCDRIHEFDDLLQDAYLIFHKLSKMYPRVVEQRQFKALFRTAMQNKMNDRASRMQRKRVFHVETSMDVSEWQAGRIAEYSNFGYVNALLSSKDHLTANEIKALLRP